MRRRMRRGPPDAAADAASADAAWAVAWDRLRPLQLQLLPVVGILPALLGASTFRIRQ